jgi:hypothetical protein
MPANSMSSFIAGPMMDASRIAREAIEGAFREACSLGITREMIALELAGESFSAAFGSGWSPADLREALTMMLDADLERESAPSIALPHA